MRAMCQMSLVLIAAAGVFSGCGLTEEEDCRVGEREICHEIGDCVCGPSCLRDLDCATSEVCAQYMVNSPGDPGVCVSRSWAGGGSTGGGGGTPNSSGCSPACTSNQMCVNNAGVPICADYCSSNSQCSTGCCATTKNGSRACGPSSYCGSSGGGGSGTCHDRTSCMNVSVKVLTSSNTCSSSSYKDMTLTATNNCSEKIYCTFCQSGGRNCDSYFFDPGQSVGGWAAFLWCTSGGNSISTKCVLQSDPMSCAQQ